MSALQLAVRRDAQLAVLRDADGVTRSVLLVRHSDAESLVMIDGLSFRLSVTLHEDLHPSALVEAMNHHYHGSVNDDAGDDNTTLCSVVQSWRGFEPSKESVIYNKLKGIGRATGSRKKAVPNKQWQLTMNNHRVLQYFLHKFNKGPFFVGGHRSEVRVLKVGPGACVQFFSPADSPVEYVLKQLPPLTSDNDTLHWGFAAPIRMTGCFTVLHGLPSNDDNALRKDPYVWHELWRFSQQRSKRFSVCLHSFDSTQLEKDRVCWRVVYGARKATVRVDTHIDSRKQQKSNGGVSEAEIDTSVAKEETEYEKWSREQFDRRTSKERSREPNRQYYAQQTLSFANHKKDV